MSSIKSVPYLYYNRGNLTNCENEQLLEECFHKEFWLENNKCIVWSLGYEDGQDITEVILFGKNVFLLREAIQEKLLPMAKKLEKEISGNQKRSIQRVINVFSESIKEESICHYLCN